MSTMVVALDIATVCGWASGHIHGNPECGSVRFASSGASDKAVFHAAMVWAQAFFVGIPKDRTVIAIERLLTPEMVRGQSNTKTIYRLAGLHGVILAVAYAHGLLDIETPSVGEIRGHFIGMRTCRRVQAKREVMRQCRAMGWAPANENEGDALAIWSYQCSLIDPRLAIRVSPLFMKGTAL